MNDSKIIHAFPQSELPENLLAIEPRSPTQPYHCNHEAVTLNEFDRTVNCARCNASLDPFNFLLGNARTIQMAWSNYREARRKLSELNDRITVLAKEEKRLAARVGRLKAKVPVVNVRGDENE